MTKQKQARVREYSKRQADIEQLKQQDEDFKFGIWEKYLLKQRDQVKKLK